MSGDLPTKAAKVKSARPPLVVKTTEGKVVCHLDRTTLLGTYFLLPTSPQHKSVAEISLRGFMIYPAGLRRNGKGLTSAGWLVLKKLGDQLGAFSLTIDATAQSHVRKTKQGARVVLNHAQLREILADLARIKSESFATQTDTVGGYLANISSALFPAPAMDLQAYKAGEVAALLKRKQVLKQLSAKDVDALTAFFPGFLKEYSGRVVGTEKLLALSKSKRAVEIVYIDKITKEFERRLELRQRPGKRERRAPRQVPGLPPHRRIQLPRYL